MLREMSHWSSDGIGSLGGSGWAITIAFANVNFSKIKLIKSYLKVKINHVTRIFSELCQKKKKNLISNFISQKNKKNSF